MIATLLDTDTGIQPARQDPTMRFDESQEGDYRIFVGAVEAPRGGDGYIAALIVHHDFAAAYRRSLAQNATPMPVLPARKRKATLLTQ